MTLTEFTPFAGAMGGALIGLSAIVLLAAAGRIAGASFIFAGLFTTELDGNFAWKALFIAGLLFGAFLAGQFWFDAAAITFPSGPAVTALSGLLVGIGVTLGNGCTSGHGICGLARFSKRSLVATLVFMAVAVATVFITRHALGA